MFLFFFYETPLLYAINKHNPTILLMLLDAGATFDKEAVSYAVKLNDIDCTKILLQKCSDDEREDYIQSCIETAKQLNSRGNDPSMELLLESKPPLTYEKGKTFVSQLNQKIAREINLVDNQHQITVDNFQDFIHLAYNTNRRLKLFTKLLSNQEEMLLSELDAIQTKQSETLKDTNAYESVMKIMNDWDKLLVSTNKTLDSLQHNIVTHSGIATANKWHEIIERRKAFIENLFDSGIDENLTLKSTEDQRNQVITQLNEVKQIKSDVIKQTNKINSILSSRLGNDQVSNFKMSRETEQELDELTKNLKSKLTNSPRRKK